MLPLTTSDICNYTDAMILGIFIGIIIMNVLFTLSCNSKGHHVYLLPNQSNTQKVKHNEGHQRVKLDENHQKNEICKEPKSKLSVPTHEVHTSEPSTSLLQSRNSKYLTIDEIKAASHDKQLENFVNFTGKDIYS